MQIKGGIQTECMIWHLTSKHLSSTQELSMQYYNKQGSVWPWEIHTELLLFAAHFC